MLKVSVVPSFSAMDSLGCKSVELSSKTTVGTGNVSFDINNLASLNSMKSLSSVMNNSYSVSLI